MKIATLSLPMMYGDHHVIAVKELLAALPGIADIYASSAFQTVEVQYDENSLTEAEITAQLEQAGYLGDLNMPVETGVVTMDRERDKAFFRHTAAFAQLGTSVGFGQHIPEMTRPLWPCPGITPVREKQMD
jgi:copper chaperone CopZ